MSSGDLHAALGRAYHLDQVETNRPAALAHLRAAMSDCRPEAEAHRTRLAAIVKARTQGARCHCHIEKVTHDLLAEALGAPNV